VIDQPLTLPCGQTLANRFCKSAMTEGLASPRGQATTALQRLYATWAQGGAGLLLSGNIAIDARYLERAGNVVVEDDSGMVALKAWADAVHLGGSLLWAQISHPGRQCPRLVNLTRWLLQRCNSTWWATMAGRVPLPKPTSWTSLRVHKRRNAMPSRAGGLQPSDSGVPAWPQPCETALTCRVPLRRPQERLEQAPSRPSRSWPGLARGMCQVQTSKA